MLSPTSAEDLVLKTRTYFNGDVTRSLPYRRKQLEAFLQFLQDSEEELIKAMHEDMRRAPEEARLEIMIGQNHIRYFLHNLERLAKPAKASKRPVDLLDGLYVYHEPYGVVLLIGTWNVPLLTLMPLAGALAAGNCVVIKPSHHSPTFSQFLAKILPDYLDSKAYPVYLGGIPETNQLLAQKFDYIYYTGSKTVGKLVHAAANRNLTPTTLELGGKNPVYLDATANIAQAAARIMWGKLFISGQACVSPDYLLCSKEVEEEFVEHAKKVITRFFGESPSLPIINDVHYARLIGLLNGTEVIVGGRVDPLENRIEPTIVRVASLNHPIMDEEIFGPILVIVRVTNVKEAVRLINQKEKALAAYVFTRDNSVRDYFLENTSSGGVTVNDTLMHLIAESLPFGGVGDSGMGRYKGEDSFYSFTNRKSVLVKNTWGLLERVNELRYPPLSAKKSRIQAILLKSRKGVSLPGWLVYFVLVLVGVLIGFLLFKN